MSDQETIDRLTRELGEKQEALNGRQAVVVFLMDQLEQVAVACGMRAADAEAYVQKLVKRWQEEHGYGNT